MAEPKQDKSIGHLRPSVVVIVMNLLAAVFLVNVVFIALLLGFFILNDLHQWHTSYIVGLIFLAIVNLAVLAGVVVQLFATWAGRNYYLLGHHLIEKRGIINITEITHELSQVKSVVSHQTWLGRRFNFGTIRLSFAGAAADKEIIIRDINDPYLYKQYFDEHLQVQGWVR